MKNRPDVLYHNGSCGDEVSSVYVVLGDSCWDADRKRRIAPEEFLHHSVDVRQMVFV